VLSIDGIAGPVEEVSGKYKFSYRGKVLELSSEKSREGDLGLRSIMDLDYWSQLQ
jgi:hypothetical protein